MIIIFRYIAWNYHETVPGRYFFEDQKDLVKFIELAQQQGLLVILRPGPYICAEWDYGGFPAWIYSICKDKIRTSNATYMKLVDRWFQNLFPRLEHLLYENGGPIIAFQVSFFTFECILNDTKKAPHYKGYFQLH